MSDRDEIANVLNRFMNCFDLKDWDLMAKLLDASILIDYSALRGEGPKEVTSDEYVRTRSEALQDLSTHHQLTNLDIAASVSSASVAASCMIHRRRGDKSFNSHAYYTFRLGKSDGVWKISAIVQRILWNEGDSTIHAGTQRKRD
jgi:hypothetical protein